MRRNRLNMAIGSSWFFVMILVIINFSNEIMNITEQLLTIIMFFSFFSFVILFGIYFETKEQLEDINEKLKEEKE